MAITFAPMTIADYDEVMALWERLDGVCLDPVSDSPASLAAYLVRNAGLSFVVRDETRIIGTVLCGHDGRRGMLHHLAVDPAYQQQGLGHALVARCLAGLQAEGIPKCYAVVVADNAAGLRFWRRAGWVGRDDRIVLQTTTGVAYPDACTCDADE